MTKRISFEGQIHEFPDDFTEQEIKQALGSSVESNSLSSYLNSVKNMIPKIGMPTGLNIASGMMGLLGKSPEQSELIRNLPQIMAGRQPTIGENIEKGIGEYAPFGAAGGASLPGQLIAGAAHGYKTTMPEEQNLFGFLPSGKLGGAIEGAGLNLAGAGIGKGIEALRPSRLFRGGYTPKQLQENLIAAGETPTGLGDVIGSPFLKRQYENVISKFPFSGATEKFQQAGQSVLNKGEQVLSNILGVNEPENVTDQISDALLKQFEQHRSNKNALYNQFNEEADKQFLNLQLPKFSSKAKEYADAIESSNILKYEPDLKRILAKLNIYKEPIVKVPGDTSQISQFGEKMIGEPLTTYQLPTAKEANLLKGKLNEYAKINRSSPDSDKRYQARIFGDLASTLKQDINDAVEASGNPALKNIYKEAESNYAKNFSPFLDKEIYKYLSGKKDTDTIVQNFVKVSRAADRGKATSQLTTLLPEKERSLVGYAYLSRALDNEGNLNPGKLSTLINNLGKNQFKALVPDENIRNELKNYNRLYKMNVKSVNLLQNPATGQQTLDILPLMAAMGGGKMGGITGALAGFLTPGLAAKPLVNMLTSPSVRKSLVDAMIKNKSWNKGVIPGLQTAIQGGLNTNR